MCTKGWAYMTEDRFELAEPVVRRGVLWAHASRLTILIVKSKEGE
jgi:hypothetical protein